MRSEAWRRQSSSPRLPNWMRKSIQHPKERNEMNPLERLRAICMALPEATERVSHGEPAWFVQDKKLFVMFADHHHDDRLAFWCAAPPGAQEVMITSAPDRFFRPPYVGVRGWLGVWLDV